MLHIQHVFSVSLGCYPFCFNVYIHEWFPQNFMGEEYLSARHWTRGREARDNLSFLRENRVRKAMLWMREGQFSQSLGHSQYGSLWYNRATEAPCFCEPSVSVSNPPPNLLHSPALSNLLAGSWTVSLHSLSNLPT